MSARDFKAKQIRTTSIIASGSVVGGEPSLLIYSASAASDSIGGRHPSSSALLAGVGTDVFMFVSGSKSIDSNGNVTYHNDSSNRVDTTVFGGDLVVSGALYAEVLRGEVDMTTTGSLSVEGPLVVTGSAAIGQSTTAANVQLNVIGNPGSDAVVINANGAQEGGTTLNIQESGLTTGRTALFEASGDPFAGQVVSVHANGDSNNAFSILEVKKASAVGSDSNAIVGVNVDFNMTDGTAGRALRIDSEQTDGVVAEIDGNALTTGKAISIESLDALTAGNALKIRSNSAARTGNLVSFVGGPGGGSGGLNANNVLALTNLSTNGHDTNQIAILYIDNNQSSGQAGRSIMVDSEQTNGIVAEIDGNAITTGAVLLVSGNAVTTGEVFKAVGKDEVTLLSLGQTAGQIGSPQAIFLSSSAVPNLDVSFFVSGSVNDRNGDAGGVALFAGDLVTSGTLYALSTLDIADDLIVGNDLHVGDRMYVSGNVDLGDDLYVGDNTYVSGTLQVGEDAHFSGSVYIGNGTSDFLYVENQIRHSGDSDTAVTFSNDTLGLSGGNQAVISLDGASSQKTIKINSTLTDTDTTIFADTGGKALIHAIAQAGQERVLILSGNEVDQVGVDVAFFVSGSKAAVGASSPMIAAFGGDLLTSGNFKVLNLDTAVTGAHVSLFNDRAGVTDAGADVRLDMATGAESEQLAQGSKLFISKAGLLNSTAAGGPFASTIANLSGNMVLRVGNSADTSGYLGQFGIALVDGFGGNFLGATGAKAYGNSAVQILSGGGGDSYNEASGADVAFYVSGSVGKKGTTVRGASVFGGDVIVSGNLHTANKIVGEGTDLDTYIKFGLSQIEINGGTDNNIRLYSDLGSSVFGINPNRFNSKVALINSNKSDVDTYIMADTDHKALFAGIAQTGNEQVLILSGGAAGSTDETTAQDVAFYVSGSVGTRGTSEKGTSVLGGDVVASGSIFTQFVKGRTDSNAYIDVGGTTDHIKFYVGGTEKVNISSADGLEVDTFVGHLGDTDTFLKFNNPDELSLAAGGRTGLYLTEGSTDIVYIGNGKNHGALGKYDQVYILSGGSGDSVDEASYTDLAFFVSGAIGSRGTSEKGTSVFGGDVFVSGGMVVGNAPGESTDGSLQDFVVNSKDAAGIINVSGQHNNIQFRTSDSSGHLNLGQDTFFQVSGTIGGKDNGGVAVFGGDLVTSGNLHAQNGEVSVHSSADPGDTFKISVGSNGATTLSTTDNSADAAHLTIHPDGKINLKTSYYGRVDFSEGSNPYLRIERSATGVNDAIIQNLEDNRDIVFRQYDDNENLRLTDDNRVLVLSGGSGNSLDPKTFTDTNFFVSGSVGSKGTGHKGTSVFGGDVVISGTLSGGSPLIIGGDVQVSGTIDVSATTALKSTALSGSLTQLADGTSYLIAGENITITSSSNGPITIASTGGSGNASEKGWIAPANNTIVTSGSLLIGTANTSNADITLGSDGSAVFNDQSAAVDFRVESNDREHAIFVDGSTDQVIILSGSSSDGNSDAESDGLDVAFYVSGAIDSSERTGHRGTALFGGDIVTSGTLKAGLGQGTDPVAILGIPPTPTGNDVELWVTGVMGSRGTSTRGTAVFGGDAFVSGALVVGTSPGESSDGSLQDFIVNTKDVAGIINVSGQHNIIQFRTSDSSGELHTGQDTFFHVSGAIGGKANDHSGVSVFGGDLFVSGVLHTGGQNFQEKLGSFVGGTISGSIHHTSGGISYLKAGSNVTITSASNGQITIAASSGGGSSLAGIDDQSSSNDDQITITDTAVIINEDSDDLDFRVESNGRTHAIFVNGENDFVEIGGGGQAFSNQDVTVHLSGTVGSEDTPGDATLVSGDLVVSGAIFGGGTEHGTGRELSFMSQVVTIGNSRGEEFGNDVNLFVSGAIGKRGTADAHAATALFGGDVAISGSAHFLSVITGSSIDTGLLKSTIGDLVIENQASDKDIVFKVNDGGSATTLMTMDADIPVIQTADGIKQSFGSPNSFISGSSTPSKGLGLTIKSSKCIWISGSQGVFFGKRTGTGHQDQGNDGGVPSSIGNDTAFFVSGAITSRGTSDRGTAVFGGDVTISGSTHFLTSLNLPLGLSGSMTKLADGTSYIKAGSNITITSASNGAITIASTGGGAASTVGWTGPGNEVIATTGSVYIGTNSTSNPDINLGSDGSAVFNEQSNSVDFRVESNSLSHMVFVDGSADQMSIGAPSAPITSDAKLVISSSTDASLLTLNVSTPDVARTKSIMSVISGSAYVFNLDKYGRAVFNPDFNNQSNPTVPDDVTFFVSGSSNVSDRHTANGGVTLFSGNIVTSGSIIPGADSTVDLGAPSNRFRNIYTGDLHLRNDKGDWTIVEERDYLCVINNITGKKYKMDLTPLED